MLINLSVVIVESLGYYLDRRNSCVRALSSSLTTRQEVWVRFQMAEEALQVEIKEVAQEAERVKPGWSESIFPQAQQLLQIEKKKQAEMERQRAEDDMKRQQEDRLSSAEDQLRKREMEADLMAQELIAEEEKRNRANSGSSNKNKKKK